MRSINRSVLFSLIFLISGMAFSIEKPRVLIADTPLDYSLKSFGRSLDEGGLKTIQIQKNGQSVSVWNFNNEQQKNQLEKFSTRNSSNQPVFPSDSFRRNLDSIDLLMNLKSTHHPMGLLYDVGLFFRAMFPGISEELVSTVWFIHGTHVTNLALNGIEDQVSLYNYPMVEHINQLDENWLNPSWAEKKIESDFDNLSKIITAANIQFVNISGGSSKTMVSRMLAEYATSKQKLTSATQFTNVSSMIAHQWTQELKKVIESHPNTLFLVAAGNESEWIDGQIQSSSKLKEPNLLIVGATEDHKLAPYSNYSNDFVTIAADGKGEAMVTPERSLLLKGTSSATPKVTRCLLQIAITHPELSSMAIKNRLLTDFVTQNEGLKIGIKNGRELNSGSCF